MNWNALPVGFAASAALVASIGAQNAYVLRLGLRGRHVFPAVVVCIASEALLVVAGVLGAGPVLATSATLTTIARWGGAAFLGAYGALAIRRALRAGSGALAAKGPAESSLSRAMATLLALTFLNPHVYLDTVVLLGALGGAQPPDGRMPFVVGALGASTLWFVALAYGARRLAPLFARPRAFRALDLGTGAIMLALSAAVVWAA